MLCNCAEYPKYIKPTLASSSMSRFAVVLAIDLASAANRSGLYVTAMVPPPPGGMFISKPYRCILAASGFH